MIYKIVLFISILLLFLGCSPKDVLLGDTKVYDDTKNYNYNFSQHSFQTDDGIILDGIYIKTTKKSKGLIVVVNGMMENMSLRFTKWLWAVEGGYDVFTFDYRGYGDSKAEANLAGFRDDVASALKYAHSIDEDRKIILVGQSMGGTYVIDALKIENYDYISLAVIDSTFTGFASNLSSLMMKTVVLFPFSWTPYTFSPTEYNAISNVEHVKTPLLFVSGDSDFITGSSNSKELYEKATAQKSIWIVEDAGHVESFDNKDVRSAFLDLIGHVGELKLAQHKYFDNQ